MQMQLPQRMEITPLLTTWLPELPKSGFALDIAAGAGRHSLALAYHGLTVDAVDISIQGLYLLKKRAGPAGLERSIRPIALNLAQGWLPLAPYQVIANFFFLERNIWPLIKTRLAPGGWLIFETYTVDQLKMPAKNKNRKPLRRSFLLEKYELREAFNFLTLVHYDEGIHNGKATAQLVGRMAGA